METESVRRRAAREPRRHAEYEPSPPLTPAQAALALQRAAGNHAAARVLARTPRLLQRTDGIAQHSGTVEQERINKQEELNKEIEDVLDTHFDGHQALFLRGECTTVDAWTDFVFDYMEGRYSGITREMVKKAIKWVKDKYRREDLKHIADTLLYSAPDRESHIYDIKSGKQLGEFLQVKGAAIDADDAEVLEALYTSKGKRTSAAFTPPAGHVVLYDDDEGDGIVVMLDDHQNKHQLTLIAEIPQYSGEPGTKFGPHVDLAWHRNNTAVVVRNTVRKAVEAGQATKTKTHHPSKKPIDDIKYDLTITYDDATANFVGSYHCNPN